MQVELYTKTDCSYCLMAKRLLAQNSIPYTEKILAEDFTREFIKQKFPTAETYPVIVVDGFYIGGATNLRTLLENQKNQTSAKLLMEG